MHRQREGDPPALFPLFQGGSCHDTSPRSEGRVARARPTTAMASATTIRTAAMANVILMPVTTASGCAVVMSDVAECRVAAGFCRSDRIDWRLHAIISGHTTFTTECSRGGSLDPRPAGAIKIPAGKAIKNSITGNHVVEFQQGEDHSHQQHHRRGDEPLHRLPVMVFIIIGHV